MTVDIEELIQWAQMQSPYSSLNWTGRRPVRLEIATGISGMSASSASGVWARAYLRDPRCVHGPKYEGGVMDDCECGPLAEKRLA